ncbi:MAG TPA: thioredoxin family protein [Rhizomicrobium sp.]|nr:thioredoxin family protein [Rhizomicrobium sp.]
MKTRAALALLMAVATPALAATAPTPSIRTLAELPVVTRAPYDEAANADALVRAAFDRAKKSGKRVLLDLGGNWCPDCLVLANFMALPEIRRFVAQHYEVVYVDVGRFDRNLHIPARFGFKDRLKGVPMVIVAEADGRLVNRGDVFATASATSMTPQALAAYLARYTK